MHTHRDKEGEIINHIQKLKNESETAVLYGKIERQ